MAFDPYAIRIDTDGSCYRNPGGQAGCAAIVYYPDTLTLPSESIVDYGCAESSNNRMELMACIKALEWVRQHKPWRDITRVQIVTDSAYVADNINRAPRWKKNKWRNRHGMPIANEDLWDQLLKARAKAGVRVDFIWQLGKKSVEARVVDKAAKAAARRGGLDVDRGYKPGAVGRSMVRGGVAQLYPASGQMDVIRPYVKKIMLKGENRISFNVLDEMAQGYTGKFYAFAAPAVAAVLHRGHGYRVEFNDEPQYPQIRSIIEEVPLP